MAGNGVATAAKLSKTQVNLKLIPGIDGTPAICQLVALNLTEITVKGSWRGPGRLHLIPHVNAPVADFPVRRVTEAHHFIADLTLPYGRVLYDYASRRGRPSEAPPLKDKGNAMPAASSAWGKAPFQPPSPHVPIWRSAQPSASRCSRSPATGSPAA